MARTITIGYFNLHLTQEWSYVPWNGIVKRAERRGVRLLSFHGNAAGSADPDAQQSNVIYDLAKRGLLDGLVAWKGHLTAELDEPGIVSFYRSYGIPTVTIEGLVPGFPGVTYGNREGMRLMTDHLIEEHGHRSIGFVGVSDFHVFEQRLDGFKDSLSAHGIAPDERLMSPSLPWQNDEGGRPAHEKFDPWLKEAIASGARAFVGVCDPVATWIMDRAEAMGLSVPRDVAVAGFDGFPSSRVSLPSLTTINPDWEGLGAKALDAALDLIEGKSAPNEIRVAPRLIRARSCGCVEENALRADFRRRRPIALSRRRSGADEAAEEAAAEARARARALAPAFAISRGRGNRGDFLDALDEGLRKSIKTGEDPQAWQDAITELASSESARRLIGGSRSSALIDQARILVSDAVEHAKAREANGNDALATREEELGQAIISSFDQDRIIDVLAPGLPGLGVDSAWLSLYEDPAPYRFPEAAPEWSRLVLAVKDGQRVPLPEGGVRFRSKSLAPDGFLPSEPGCFAVEPIRFHSDQIGFIVMAAAAGRGKIYGALSAEISAGLKGTRLVEEIGRRSRTLEAGVASLSVSGEEMFRSMEAVSSSVAKQTKAVGDEAASIHDLDQNILSIADVSRETLASSARLDEKAEAGAASLKTLLGVMENLQSHSKDILGLIGLIQEFADMTKLLAFNAAVESARLGAAGKGFGVIAKDIRSLAENADSNAKRIGAIVEKVAALIGDASRISRETGDGLDAILEYSKENENSAAKLSAAMDRQADGLGGINDTTRMLTDITAEIEGAVAEQTRAMEDLKNALAMLSADAKRSAAG